MRRLAGDDQAAAIIEPFTSSEAEVAFPVANQMEIVATSQASSKPGLAQQNRPWAFRNTVDEGAYLNSVTPVLVEQANVEDVAIAYDAANAVGTAIGLSIMPTVFSEAERRPVGQGAGVTPSANWPWGCSGWSRPAGRRA